MVVKNFYDKITEKLNEETSNSKNYWYVLKKQCHLRTAYLFPCIVNGDSVAHTSCEKPELLNYVFAQQTFYATCYSP